VGIVEQSFGGIGGHGVLHRKLCIGLGLGKAKGVEAGRLHVVETAAVRDEQDHIPGHPLSRPAGLCRRQAQQRQQERDRSFSLKEFHFKNMIK